MFELQELPTKSSDVTGDKSLPRAPRGCNTIRSRCIQFIQILEQNGYERLPLEEAKRVFSQTLGIYDRSSIKAYFGTQAGITRHTVERFARYQSGASGLKTIELSQRIAHHAGYLEILGLVTYELKGRVWFLSLKRAILVPTLVKPSASVPMQNISLSSLVTEAYHSGREGDELQRGSMVDRTTNKQQQHRVRERNSAVYETVYEPEPDQDTLGKFVPLVTIRNRRFRYADLSLFGEKKRLNRLEACQSMILRMHKEGAPLEEITRAVYGKYPKTLQTRVQKVIESGPEAS